MLALPFGRANNFIEKSHPPALVLTATLDLSLAVNLAPNFQIRPWLNFLDSGYDGINLTCDARPIRRDHHYRQQPALQILLKLNALICCKQKVISFFFR